MDKKNLILDAMQELLTEKKGAACSVSDIAKKAGIAKGGIYYYFHSKEDIFDALVKRTYHTIITQCEKITIEKSSALTKLKKVYQTYRLSLISNDFDSYLHVPENAAIHQKSLAEILHALSRVIADILKEGDEKKELRCQNPQEVSEILLSVFCFLLDPGIFQWSQAEISLKLKVLSRMLEQELSLKEGSMSFLYNV